MIWKRRIEKLILKLWYTKNIFSYLLLPFSFIFYLIIITRKYLYQKNIITKKTLPLPVIIVGNITVGGNGKTPLVIWLANFLKKQGYKPGIISRGYGGKPSTNPIYVTAESDPRLVGDEPIIIAKQTHCPTAIATKRIDAAQLLLTQKNCNILISDDGLQHYSLSRTIEIAVIDNERKMGNGFLLPAGPLREPITRLKEIDFTISLGKEIFTPIFSPSFCMQYVPEQLINIQMESTQCSIHDFKGKKIHVIAGIGNPDRFFKQLTELGLDIIAHSFPDHYPFTSNDFNFLEKDLPIIMTEKDAIKCRAFAKKEWWYLPVKTIISPEFETHLLKKLSEFSNT
ncbi:MAG: Tetraacyldisaccharide 4'-kinase [Legionellaceae bacterium]